MFIKKMVKSFCLGAVGFFCMPAMAAQVDLLLLYDDFTRDRYNGAPVTAMNSWIDNANAAYVASQVDIQINLVGLEYYEPSASGISDRLGEIRNSSRVAALRNQYGADFTALIAGRDGNTCGIGYLSTRSSGAFNVTGVQCGYLTLIHEIGHNMGLGHSRRQGSSGVRYSYALGYGVDNQFSTVMAYPQAFNSRKRLNRFSDPNRNCEGFTCGVPIGQPEEADAHTALNNLRFEFAYFRDSVNGGGTAGGGSTGGDTGGSTGGEPPTPEEVPAPSNLSATAQEQTISIVWRDNSTLEDYFEIQRSTSSNSGFSRMTTTARGSTSYSDQGLDEGTQYYYRVRAHKAGVDSDWSNTTSATTAGPVAIEVPAPTNLQATAASSSSVNVTWEDNSYNENFFAVQRSTSANSGFSEVGTVGRGSTSFIDQDLSSGSYYYRVLASKEGVLSEWSNVADVSLNGSSEPQIPPADGSGLNLFDLGLRLYTTQTGDDARAYIANSGASLGMHNNVWVASTSTFNIASSTVLAFDYSSDVSGEIHGIGFDENDQPSSNRIFKLGGSQSWGINGITYTGDGAVQRFEIPVGQYYTGDMYLVMSNDFDAGTGNTSYISNVRVYDAAGDVGADERIHAVFGLEYLDDTTAILFHNTGQQADVAHELCINGDCAQGDWTNGRFEREVEANLGDAYLIEYRVQQDSDECSTSAMVDFDAESVGQSDSPCH